MMTIVYSGMIVMKRRPAKDEIGQVQQGESHDNTYQVYRQLQRKTVMISYSGMTVMKKHLAER